MRIKTYPDLERLSGYTELISRSEAELIIEVCERQGFLNPKEAHKRATELMGFFLTREAIDPEQFTLGVSQLFQSYHKGFVKRVVDPVTGLPSREKWLPSLAVIKEALVAEEFGRAVILSKAKWTLQEIERRKVLADESARTEASKGSEEQRRVLVQSLLKPRPISEGWSA